ncbi:cell division inhibitor MinD-like (ATPase involved in chromosome partitioning) [Salinarchaeum sp. Harcht-Bsk1]|uniref:MinD/ParA family ATP-binding protein n=1 Tax=Salinarchaeum sp. Harcht-Bsk1 TaxID=1333523 RepID=UPI00034229E5|nr:MinD/ParA family protein [Salinarchaeum sp. Harcht-Bsk1]AGN01758.1 cell division inhibitor MinD-like (ATPase involved in chromosome partitioning) [Salinarchaeum sp. Harcht-Bsk1]
MILAVVGGKGGVGKSTVALNVGAELDGVVVDADLGMADLPYGPGPDLHDVLAGRADPLEAVRERGGASVDVLPCGRTLAGARAADPTALVDALRRVESHYGAVVVDCPAGMAADAGLPLCAAGRCLLVTTPDGVAVPDALRTRALARVLDAGIERVVLNRARDPPVDRVQRTLGAPVTVVPEHEAVDRARNEGRAVASVAPESVPTERFSELAGALQ